MMTLLTSKCFKWALHFPSDNVKELTYSDTFDYDWETIHGTCIIIP